MEKFRSFTEKNKAYYNKPKNKKQKRRNTMKENKFKSVTALVLTFVLIFAVFVPIFSISAAALV